MSTFKSPEVLINKSAREFFNKISDLNNLKEILPNDIRDFKSTTTKCSFKMNDLPELVFEISEKIKFSKISFKAIDSQVPLSLNCYISASGNQCQARIEIEAELNMMMRMMIEKPLKSFLNIISTKLQKI